MSGTRILIVNEEPVLREFFRVNLQARGFDVIVSTDSSEVFDTVKKEKPEITIIDLMLSGVNGFELCRRICESGESAVIVSNMRGGEADLLKCLEMGVDDYLGKPFGVDELMARVRAVVRCKRKYLPNGQASPEAKLGELSKIS